MKASTVKRLAMGTLAVIVALSMMGFAASAALAEEGGVPVQASEDPPISIPEGTPTTMSWMSTVPTSEASESTVVEPTSEVAPTLAPVVAAITSLPVPNGVQAGGGGTAGADIGPWLVLTLGVCLVLGLSASAIARRRPTGTTGPSRRA